MKVIYKVFATLTLVCSTLAQNTVTVDLNAPPTAVPVTEHFASYAIEWQGVFDLFSNLS